MVDRRTFLVLTVGVLAGVFAVFLFYDIGENRVAAMNAMITADAAIIGFLAVVATFMLTSLQAELRRARGIEEKLEKDYHSLLKRCFEESTYGEYDDMMKRACVCGFQEGWIKGTIDNTVIWSVVSVVSFIVSIMAALVAMGNTPIAQYIGIYVSVGAFVIGNLALIFILTRFRSIPSKRNLERNYDAKSHRIKSN